MAIFGSISGIKKFGKTQNLPTEPRVPKIGQPYNPEHDRYASPKPPRILPANTRMYTKAATQTDPSQFNNVGFSGGNQWYTKKT